MVLTVKNAAPADFYFQGSGLEADPNWARGIWYCPSEQLGVKHKSEVAVDALALLLDRRRPDIFDRRDYLRNDSPDGRDFVFSAPKSASLLWSLAVHYAQQLDFRVRVEERTDLRRVGDLVVRNTDLVELSPEALQP